MAVDRYVSCDICGIRIVRLLESESLEDEVIGAGGCPASLHPDGMDVCAKHVLKDNRALRAVRAYTGETDPAPVG